MILRIDPYLIAGHKSWLPRSSQACKGLLGQDPVQPGASSHHYLPKPSSMEFPFSWVRYDSPEPLHHISCRFRFPCIRQTECSGESSYTYSPKLYLSVEAHHQDGFGPLLVIYPYQSGQEAVKLASDTSVGLAGYIFTNSLPRAWRVEELLEGEWAICY